MILHGRPDPLPASEIEEGSCQWGGGETLNGRQGGSSRHVHTQKMSADSLEKRGVGDPFMERRWVLHFGKKERAVPQINPSQGGPFATKQERERAQSKHSYRLKVTCVLD